MKFILKNFDKYYMEPLFIKNIEGEPGTILSEEEEKLAKINAVWGKKGADLKKVKEESKIQEDTQNFLIQKSDDSLDESIEKM